MVESLAGSIISEVTHPKASTTKTDIKTTILLGSGLSSFKPKNTPIVNIGRRAKTILMLCKTGMKVHRAEKQIIANTSRIFFARVFF